MNLCRFMSAVLFVLALCLVSACTKKIDGSSMDKYYTSSAEVMKTISGEDRQLEFANGLELLMFFSPDASAALRHLDAVDEVLCMTVYPGFGGQAFKPGPLETVRRLRAAAPALRIMVDGGISRDTLPAAAAAGADAFVAGSALFHAADMAAEIALFRRLFASHCA